MKYLHVIILIAAILFFVFIVFVSILGENHSIDNVVNSFFRDIKNRDFIEAARYLTQDQKEILDNNDFSEMSFLLEMSLLEKYDLMEKGDYRIHLKRNQFWLPFLNKDRIGVSVLLKEVERHGGGNKFFFNEHINYIEDLIVVKRESGGWRITDINIDNSEIKDAYRNLKLLLNNNRYIKMKSDRIIELHNKIIDLGGMQSCEKRVLKYILFEIIRKIDNSVTTHGRMENRENRDRYLTLDINPSIK
ncbi:MAG: hypothetical protein HKP58_17575 [Desulfatitalea sp.]|nr:hypothetical protein [Desulfatitalea sp.]NNK02225.1 hypothetical protein [Desulfatitalea sp.]